MMSNDILFLNLKRMRYNLKLAAAEVTNPIRNISSNPISPPVSTADTDVIEGEPDPDEDSPLNWKGEDPTENEWAAETPTSMAVDPKQIREDIMTYLSAVGRDPSEVDDMSKEDIRSLHEEYTRWYQHKNDDWHRVMNKQIIQDDLNRGTIPGTGGEMTEASRQEGIAKTKRDHPELFDPKRQKMMKGWKKTYNRYRDPVFPTERSLQLANMMQASGGYQATRLDDDLAASLSGILGDYLLGKSITISTGTPTLPKTEEVKIIDVDTDDQKIMFETVNRPSFKFFTSYDDFFYHKKWDGKTDGERSLPSVFPPVHIPRKGSAISSAWKNLLKIKAPWAKE